MYSQTVQLSHITARCVQCMLKIESVSQKSTAVTTELGAVVRMTGEKLAW